MNAVFFVFCCLSMGIMCFTSPDKILQCFLSGAEKALLLSFSLITVYSVWMGVFDILERSGANDRFAKLLLKPVKKAFFNPSDEAAKLIALNISANMLGLGGVATPLGIKACAALEKQNNRDAANLLLIVAATSIQLLPTSVLALMSKFLSQNPSAVILPCLLSTLISSLSGVCLFLLCKKIKGFYLTRKNSKLKQKSCGKVK